MSETKKDPAKSAGPYTPATSPVEVGEKSGGEWQFGHSSAAPQPPKR